MAMPFLLMPVSGARRAGKGRAARRGGAGWSARWPARLRRCAGEAAATAARRPREPRARCTAPGPAERRSAVRRGRAPTGAGPQPPHRCAPASAPCRCRTRTTRRGGAGRGRAGQWPEAGGPGEAAARAPASFPTHGLLLLLLALLLAALGAAGRLGALGRLLGGRLGHGEGRKGRGGEVCLMQPIFPDAAPASRHQSGVATRPFRRARARACARARARAYTNAVVHTRSHATARTVLPGRRRGRRGGGG